ncbi:DsrE family protein [Longibacter salinarum]|nr:DsrE family protein [Longibacter salinarum]
MMNPSINRAFYLIPMVVMALLMAPGQVQSQPATPEDAVHAPSELDDRASAPGVVFLVRTPQHIRAAIKTAGDLQASEALQGKPVEIVVCGKAVKHLGKDDAVAEAIRTAEASGPVSVFACGMSMANLGVERSDVMSEVRVVPNGLVHTLERQAVGYLSVDL